MIDDICGMHVDGWMDGKIVGCLTGIGTVVAVPAHGALVDGTWLRHTPPVRDSCVQHDVHGFLWYYSIIVWQYDSITCETNRDDKHQPNVCIRVVNMHRTLGIIDPVLSLRARPSIPNSKLPSRYLQ